MTTDELKRAMVEVKKICNKYACCKCPFHKPGGGVVYCAMNPYDENLGYPACWDVDDWKGDAE